MKHLLIFLLLSTIAIRFLWLDRFPVGVTNDELEYLLSAKSYALVGHDISGTKFPQALFGSGTEGSISIIPPVITSIYFKFLPLNQLTARVLYTFVGLFSALAFYFIALFFFQKRNLATLAVVLFLINPWSFYLSRFTTDVSFALLFYLAGTASVFWLSGRKLVFSFTFFVLGFLSYHGAKPLFLPLILIAISARYYFKSFPKRQLIIFGLVSAVFFFGYYLLSSQKVGSTYSSRVSEVFFLSDQILSERVNIERKISLENPLTSLFSNKLTAGMGIFTEKYLTAFSPEVLYLRGDTRAAYRFENHGLFYVIDLFFLVLGALFLFKQEKGVFLCLVSILLIAPLSTAINRVETSVIHRSFLMLPAMVLFSVYGVYQTYILGKKVLSGKIVIVGLSAIYIFSFINFLSFYFFRFPVTHQETYLLSEKILAKYLSLEKDTFTVITEKPRATYLRLLFYLLPDQQENTLRNIKVDLSTTNYRLDNVSFTNICLFDKVTPLAVQRNIANCFEKNSADFSILDQKDAGQIFKIIKSDVCKDKTKDTWRRQHLLSDYDLTNMSDDQFCLRWIAK